MTKPVTKAKDLSVETIEIAPGLLIDNKIRVSAILYLEIKYDKSIGEIDFNSGRVRDFVNLLVGLVLQHNPDMTEKDAERTIGQFDTEQLQGLTNKLKNLFATDLKNSPGPVVGNLTESKT